MLVKSLQIVSNPFLDKNDSIGKARHIFNTVSYISLPVVDANGYYWGLVNRKDIKKMGANDGIADITRYITPLSEDNSLIDQVLRGDNDIFPVTSMNNILKGFIGRNHIVCALQQECKKKAEELAKKQCLAKKLEAIFESSYDGLYICDHNGIITMVNSAWERICGFSRELVLGKAPYDLVTKGWYSKSAAHEAFATKKMVSVMLQITLGPKKGTSIIATATPILKADKTVERIVVNVRDITELIGLQEKLKTTEELSRHYASELEEIRMQNQGDNIVAHSAAMRRILEMVARVSQVDSTVLITGESGVGKEVIAKRIHYLSDRRKEPLIKVNCGAIPEHLLESELFGYEGGAFTGAKREGKPGMFELANGGTLFLDEVGELPLNLQVKLLRALQEKEINRVGGVKTISVNIRIIAATNRDLGIMVRRETFRDDLYYRLNVVNIRIPPLRERRDDVPVLLHVILQKFNQKYNQNKKLTTPVVERMTAYDWPGNIREIENVIERLVVLISENNIKIEHLPEFLQERASSGSIVRINGIIPYKKAIAELEKQLIAAAIAKYGSTRKAARALEINQSTIVRKMQMHRLEKLTDVYEHQSDAWEHQLRI